MACTYSKLGVVAVAALLTAVPACSTSSEAPPETSSAAASTSAAADASGKAGKTDRAPTEEVPATTGSAGGDTVLFEVTGTGTATTIDLVPSGDQRLYDVPLPWSSTVSIGPEVSQLQVVVVGSGVTNPGCRITLNGEVVAEQPEGGDAHCVFDR